jgi:surfactin family lipopeptide synthetase A
LARRLRAKGVKPDGIVGIMVERSFEMIVGILGILKAGGAYLPIDPVYPEDRIRFMLEDSGTGILLTQSRLSGKVEFHGETLNLDEAGAYEGDATDPVPVGGPENLAYVIYTSGSTGWPKGVMVEHRNVVNLVAGQRKIYGIDERDRVLQFYSVSFDPSAWLICTTLLSGAALCLIDETILLDRVRFNHFLRDHEISFLSAVPSFLEEVDIEEARNLKSIVSGGEICSAGLAKRLGDKLAFYNVYGPTEATVVSSLYHVDPDDIGASVPIGKPIANYQAYILGAGHQPVPLGVPGELCMAGDGVARGYLNRPALTAEKFADNPFVPGGRMYRTGDLARWRPDGNIEFLGRMDHQVKIRGFRVELGEIESRLLDIESVKEAVVVAREDASGDKYLCAYVVSDEEIPAGELRRALSETLPDYMVPPYFVQLAAWPLTPNGKIDRKALPAPEGSLGKEYVAPETEQEIILAKAFGEILGIEKIGLHDDFFALGGDSIKAIRIVSKLREAGYELNVSDIMTNPVVGMVSKTLKTCEEKTLYEQGEVTGAWPLTPIQRWFFTSEFGNRNHFNQAIMLKTAEKIDVNGLTAALGAIVKHHDILRAVYRDGKPELLGSAASAGFSLHEYDYRESGLGQEDLAKAIEEKNNAIQASIDIEQGPLMKVALFRTDEADHLMVCIHHLAVDGVSWRIFVGDLETGYRQHLSGAEIKFSDKTASYKDWGEALQAYSESDVLRQEADYWKHIANKIPEGRIRKTFADGNGMGFVSLALNRADTEKLLYQSGKAFGTEINDLLISSLGLALQKTTGQATVSVNLEGHGREAIHRRIDIDRTMGWFTSVYPIVVELGEGVKETIIRTKEMLRKVPNKGMGYGVLRYLSDALPRREEAEIAFNYLGSIDTETGSQDGAFGMSAYSAGRSVALENLLKDTLSINGMVSGGLFNVEISYRKDRFTDEEAEQFAAGYREALQDVIHVCLNQEEVVKTSSDFGLDDDTISQTLLEAILSDF